ncbi:MFS transporter [Allobranchiibius sp. GilTou73]|uniref:MFS transporter n=1 Tax=Allobranchiibius sp. GilTou73 TaxID=2904523 RepID=UPI001F27170C|nr:MFS transporter [Allobranchiibius sp. GilTou73]UIJ36211.1 MFS transporter [Allobranchiibius sp. GilTou73]
MTDADGYPEGSNPARWLALYVCLGAVFMCLLDVSIVNVALPSMQEGLKATSSDLQWVLSGYAVTFGLVLVPAGRLGDAYSRRTMFLIGITGFVIASVACGLAWSPLAIVVFRLLQGIFAGLLTPQVNGIIQQLFRGPERGRAFGYFGAIAGVSTAAGPLAGGGLIALFGTEHGWRTVFFVNLPIGMVAIPFAARLLTRAGVTSSRGTGRRPQLDPVGSLLFCVGIVSLLLPLVEQREWSGAVRYPLYAVAVLFLALFVLWERRVESRGKAPVLDLRLFSLRSFSFGSVTGLLYFGAFTSIFFVLTVYLQMGQGYSAWQAGLTVTAFAAATIPASRLSGSKGPDHPIAFLVTGSLLFAAGLLLTILAVQIESGSHVGWWIAVPLVVAGFGNGLVLPANQTRVVSQVPVEQASSAGAAYQVFQRTGTALGIAVVGSVFFGQLASSRGDFSQAFEYGVSVSAGLGILTAVLAGAEALSGRLAVSRAGRAVEP